MKWYVELISLKTDRVVRRLGPFKSEREARSVKIGAEINLDHERFYIETREG